MPTPLEPIHERGVDEEDALQAGRRRRRAVDELVHEGMVRVQLLPRTWQSEAEVLDVAPESDARTAHAVNGSGRTGEWKVGN